MKVIIHEDDTVSIAADNVDIKRYNNEKTSVHNIPNAKRLSDVKVKDKGKDIEISAKGQVYRHKKKKK